MTGQERRMVPWVLAALAMGVMTGFVFGEGRNAPSSALEEQATPTPVATAPAEPTTAAAASPTSPPPVTPSGSPLACAGGPVRKSEPGVVIGVREMGVEDLALVMGVPPSSRPFADLASDDAARREMTAEALEAAARGPIALVLQLSSGDYQSGLARDVVAASPESVPIVVVPSGEPSVGDLERFPERAIAVTAPPQGDVAGRKTWATALQAVLTLEAPCSGR